jgi:hypothetical protein
MENASEPAVVAPQAQLTISDEAAAWLPHFFYAQ